LAFTAIEKGVWCIGKRRFFKKSGERMAGEGNAIPF
jgi:hypothetical protein